jgi:hypothetical protein
MYEYIKYPNLEQLQQSLVRYTKDCNDGINDITSLLDNDTEYQNLVNFFNIKKHIAASQMFKIIPVKNVSKRIAHIDNINGVKYSLNIPVLNYKGTSTIFYKPNTKLITKSQFPITDQDTTKIPVKIFTYNINQNSQILGEYPTKEIFCMDTSIPHYVHNPNLYHRYTLLIRLRDSWSGSFGLSNKVE